MSDTYNNEEYKIVMTFKNDKSYTILTSDDGSDISGNIKVITSLSTNDNEAVTSGNPVGILTSNSIDIEIVDTSGILSILNKNSPYYNYMKNGAKIEVYIEGANGFEPNGKYYVTDWSSPFVAGEYEAVKISGVDILNYIGNKAIPKLPAYSGIRLDELITSVLTGIGMSTNEFYIDKSINYSMPFGVTTGAKVRDFLNSVAQATLSRVIVDKSGVLRIVNSLKTYGKQYTLFEEDFESINPRHNNSNTYNKVRIVYPKSGDSNIDILAMVQGFTAVPGLNTINNIEFENVSEGIQEVYIDASETGMNLYNIYIDDIKWNGYQKGVSISFNNTATTELKGLNIYILGELINSVKSFKESEVYTEDDGEANVLELENDMIQTDDLANNLAFNTSTYLKKMNKLISVDSRLTPKASTGDRLILAVENSSYRGNYKIISSAVNHGPTVYNNSLELILEEDVKYWKDNKIWDDSSRWSE